MLGFVTQLGNDCCEGQNKQIPSLRLVGNSCLNALILLVFRSVDVQEEIAARPNSYYARERHAEIQLNPK